MAAHTKTSLTLTHETGDPGASADSSDSTVRRIAPAPKTLDDGLSDAERRLDDRWRSDGSAVAYGTAGELFGQRFELKLIDESYRGVGAVSPHPVTPGTVVRVGFNRFGAIPQDGVVLRCLPCGEGYRLAILFDRRMAA